MPNRAHVPAPPAGTNFAAKQRKKERHHDVPKNEPRKMAAKLRFGPPKRRDFLMRAMHQLSVPNESKKEDETKRCNECDKEFFPVHNLFRLRFLLSPIEPERLHRKTLLLCRSKS